LTEIADQFQNWLKNRSEKWGVPVLDAPEDERRDDFVLPYRKNCKALFVRLAHRRCHSSTTLWRRMSFEHP